MQQWMPFQGIFHFWFARLTGRTVNNLIWSAYVGGMVQLGLALWAIGDCTVWSQAQNQTWLQQ